MSGQGAKSKTDTSSVKNSGLSSSISKMESKKTKTGNSSVKEEKSLLYFSLDSGKLTESDLKKVKKKKVQVNGETIALISHNNKVFAIQEKCPHYGGPLHQGDIEDMPLDGPCIRCPWHSWKFSLDSGKCVSPQRDDKCIKIFPTKIKEETNEILIGFEKISDSIFK